MLVDGRTIAKDMLDQVATNVAQLEAAPRLSIVTCTPDLPTQKYLALKKRKAVEAGMRVNVIELLDSCDTDGVIKTVTVAADESDGVIVQLPLPDHIDTDKVLAHIPVSRDVDAVHYAGEGDMLPPVVGAIAEIVKRHNVTFANKQVVIIGAGRLVGAPALLWVCGQGSSVDVITQETETAEAAALLRQADIIISGAGVAGLVSAAGVADGVAIFDAGTSEDGGALVGDVDPQVVDKASLLTPVPGGIGPVTVACLLQNLAALTQQKGQ